MNDVGINVARGFDFPDHDGERLIGTELLAAYKRAAELVTGRLKGAHGECMVDLEMVAEALVHNQLGTFKRNWTQI